VKFAQTAWRIAYRDLKASPGQWSFTVFTIALSFASLSGVRSAAVTVADGLAHGSRQWLAADVSVSLDNAPVPEEVARLNQLRGSRIDWTQVISAMSSVASDASPDASFAIVKAVDPAAYPYYGRVLLDPPQPLKAALTPETAVVSSDVLSRLSVQIGERIRIGGQPFRIIGMIRSEPDRFSGIPGAGMRCMLSMEGYARTGIARGGSYEFRRLLLRVPPTSDVDAIARTLESWFPGDDVTDARDANPQLLWAIGTALSLLSLPPFLALAIGACGIAIAVRSYVERRLDTAATMKMLGGQNRHVYAIFGLQILAMIAAGILLGIPLGWIAKSSVLAFAARFGPFPAEGFSARELIEGAVAAGIAIVPALVRPILLVRRLSPAALLRRNTEERTPQSKQAPEGMKLAVIAFVCFFVIGTSMLQSWDSAAFLLLALAANTGIVWLYATLCVGITRKLAFLRILPAPARYGLANLHRPANRSRALIVAIGTGLSTLTGTFETHSVIARSIVASLPFDHANLLIAAMNDSELQGLPSNLRSIPGVEGEPRILNLAWIRLVTIDGVKKKNLPRQWLASCIAGSSGVTLSSTAAKLMGAKIGSAVQFEGRNGPVGVTIRAVRDVDPMQEIFSSFQLGCDVIDSASIFHDAAIRVRTGELSMAARDLRARYPMLGVISAEDLASTISDLTHQTEALVRMLAWYTLAAGISVLIAIAMASRAARLDEMATLFALGATRGWVVKAYLVEFAAIGLLAGLAGGILSAGFESLMLSMIFRRPTFQFEPFVAILSFVISACATAAAAWLPAYPLRKQTPMQMLRRLKGA
jgi:putative ABC transport system permease protein